MEEHWFLCPFGKFKPLRRLLKRLWIDCKCTSAFCIITIIFSLSVIPGSHKFKLKCSVATRWHCDNLRCVFSLTTTKTQNCTLCNLRTFPLNRSPLLSTIRDRNLAQSPKKKYTRQVARNTTVHATAATCNFPKPKTNIPNPARYLKTRVDFLTSDSRPDAPLVQEKVARRGVDQASEHEGCADVVDRRVVQEFVVEGKFRGGPAGTETLWGGTVGSGTYLSGLGFPLAVCLAWCMVRRAGVGVTLAASPHHENDGKKLFMRRSWTCLN